jgi:hypothetical protein
MDNGRTTMCGVITGLDTVPEKTKKRRPHKKHWYKRTITECPVCGRGKDYRERVYGEKPEDPKEIYKYEVHYDWCNAL